MSVCLDSLIQRLKDHFGLDFVLAQANIAILPDTLNETEKNCYQAFPSPKRQADWLLGRTALKQVLQALGLSADISLIFFPHKTLSLTHSGQTALALGLSSDCARETGVIGVGLDWEAPRSINFRSVRLYLNPQEQAQLVDFETAAPEQSAAKRVQLWTIKEALLKADPDNRTLQTTYTHYLPTDLLAPSGPATRLNPDGSPTPYRFEYFSTAFSEGFLTVAVCYQERIATSDF